MGKPTSDQVGRAGEAFVTAELLRRGCYAVMFSGNMPGIDIIATDSHHASKVTIQVKTKSSGTWQTDIRRGRWWRTDPQDGRYWILVDLAGEAPVYYVMPAFWIERNIYQAHKRYVDRAGGERAVNPNSTHHSITVARVEQWRERWDILPVVD